MRDASLGQGRDFRALVDELEGVALWTATDPGELTASALASGKPGTFHPGTSKRTSASCLPPAIPTTEVGFGRTSKHRPGRSVTPPTKDASFTFAVPNRSQSIQGKHASLGEVRSPPKTTISNFPSIVGLWGGVTWKLLSRTLNSKGKFIYAPPSRLSYEQPTWGKKDCLPRVWCGGSRDSSGGQRNRRTGRAG